jgi:protein OS-9
MTMTDTILFVKEAKTCSYILVIHTPRLCSEPGFKSRMESRDEALIRCREIVDSASNQHSDHNELPEADHPDKLPRRKQNSIISSPESKGGGSEDKAGKYDELIRKALEALVGDNSRVINQDGEHGKVIIEQLNDNGELLIEFVDEVAAFGEGVGGIDHSAIAEALRAVGFDIKAEKSKEPEKGDGDEQTAQKNAGAKEVPGRDEL